MFDFIKKSANKKTNNSCCGVQIQEVQDSCCDINVAETKNEACCETGNPEQTTCC
jgi:hypothetical protein